MERSFRTRENLKFKITIVICVVVAFLLAHPATRPLVLAIFPFIGKTWRFFMFAGAIGAAVFGIFSIFNRRIGKPRMNFYELL